MALVYNPLFSEVFFSREMGAVEKVGHWMSRCELRSPEVEDWMKLGALVQWATGIRLHPEASVMWDSKSRIMKVHFTPKAYHQVGNRWFSEVVEAMKASKRGLPLSASRLPFWLFHFPSKVEDNKPVEEQKVEKPFVPKAVRNVKRKKKEPVYEAPERDLDDE